MNSRWIKFAWLNSFRNKRRSLVTLTIAALGSAAILLSGGFANSTYEGLAQSAARSSGHLVIAQADFFNKEEDVPLQYGIENSNQIEQRLLANAQVRYVLPRIEFNGLISNGEKSTIMIGAGIEPDSEFAIKGPFVKVLEGQILQSNSKEADILLGSELAKSLKAHPGSNLTLMSSTVDGALNAIDVNVKGVVSTGIPDIDKRLVYSDIKTIQKLLNTQKISSLGVFLSEMAATDHVQMTLQSEFDQSKESKIKVQTWLDQAFFYKSVRDLYNRIFGTLGFIISLIVVFVVGNAMAMAIIERTREIGSLRALGTYPIELIKSFAFEGMFIGAGGAISGALLATLVSVFLLIFPVNMPPPPGRSEGYPLLISITPSMYAVTFFGIVVLSMLASALVARKTINKPITSALAHV